jgi:hypothetical protein
MSDEDFHKHILDKLINISPDVKNLEIAVQTISLWFGMNPRLKLTQDEILKLCLAGELIRKVREIDEHMMPEIHPHTYLRYAQKMASKKYDLPDTEKDFETFIDHIKYK